VLPLSIDLAPSNGEHRHQRHVAGAATRGRAVNAESPDDVRCTKARMQVAARHGTARVCPTVHNTRPQKTHERTTQFFRSVLGGRVVVVCSRGVRTLDWPLMTAIFANPHQQRGCALIGPFRLHGSERATPWTYRRRVPRLVRHRNCGILHRGTGAYFFGGLSRESDCWSATVQTWLQ
jgi:hypothetical protein